MVTCNLRTSQNIKRPIRLYPHRGVWEGPSSGGDERSYLTDYKVFLNAPSRLWNRHVNTA